MGNIIIVILASLCASVATAAESNTVWDRYIKAGQIEYKNFEQIDFTEVSQKNLNLPSSLEKVRAELVQFTSKNNQTHEDDFDFKVMKEIQDRFGNTDWGVIKKLTIKQNLELAIDISQRSMSYQYVRTHQPLVGHTTNIDSVECFLAGKGVCSDYAYNFARIFYWLKDRNPILKNVYVLYTHGDTFESAVADKVADLLMRGFSNTHAWNTIVYFTDEGMVYSHIDLTGAEGKLGKMKEGRVGYHLSESNNINLAQLLESVGEYDDSLALFSLDYALENDLNKPSVIERIRQLNHLIQVSSKACTRSNSCQYYTELAKLIQRPKTLENSLKYYCDTANE